MLRQRLQSWIFPDLNSRLADIITGRIAMNVLASQFPPVQNMQKTHRNMYLDSNQSQSEGEKKSRGF